MQWSGCDQKGELKYAQESMSSWHCSPCRRREGGLAWREQYVRTITLSENCSMSSLQLYRPFYHIHCYWVACLHSFCESCGICTKSN